MLTGGIVCVLCMGTAVWRPDEAVEDRSQLYREITHLYHEGKAVRQATGSADSVYRVQLGIWACTPRASPWAC